MVFYCAYFCQFLALGLANLAPPSTSQAPYPHTTHIDNCQIYQSLNRPNTPQKIRQPDD